MRQYIESISKYYFNNINCTLNDINNRDTQSYKIFLSIIMN